MEKSMMRCLTFRRHRPLMAEKRELLLGGVLAIMVVILAFSSPGFLTLYNIMNILKFCASIGIISIGMTFVMVSGGIDLSVGSIFALVSMFALSFQPIPEVINPGAGMAVWARNHGLPLPAIIVGSLILGGLAGFINGAGINKLKIQPFVMTMATMMTYRGLALFWSQGFGAQGVTPQFEKLGGTKLFGIPSPVLWYFALLLISYYVLHQTTLGRSYFLIGKDRETSHYSGIRVERLSITTYVIVGVLTAISALLYSSWTTTVEPWAGRGYELTAIAAVLIGGGSTSGGTGSIVGTTLGVLILGVLFNAFAMLRVGAYVSKIVQGIVMLAIVLMYSIRSK